jgi:hypothetical protein
MTRMTTILTTTAACLALATACSDNTGPARSRVENAASGADSLNILVDASRDGGVWWFPQAGPFDPDTYHQGSPLVTYLRGKGHQVNELGRPTTITPSLLQPYAIVIRAGEFGAYTAEEIAAYRQYVDGGGRVLLLADHMRYAPPDDLALGFGLMFVGVTQGGNVLEFRAGHPITDGLGSLAYGVGSALVSAPASAELLGSLDSTSFVDLNDNGLRDANEPVAPLVFGAMAFGSGRVVFCGDANLWEWVMAQRLVDNVLAWLGAGR